MNKMYTRNEVIEFFQQLGRVSSREINQWYHQYFVTLNSSDDTFDEIKRKIKERFPLGIRAGHIFSVFDEQVGRIVLSTQIRSK